MLHPPVPTIKMAQNTAPPHFESLNTPSFLSQKKRFSNELLCAPSSPLATLSPNCGLSVPLTPASTPVSSPFASFSRRKLRASRGEADERTDSNRGDPNDEKLVRSDGFMYHEGLAKALKKLELKAQGNSAEGIEERGYQIKKSKSESNLLRSFAREKIQEAVKFLTTEATGVKDAAVWIGGKKPLEYIHYETLRDYATVEECRKWALGNTSPILKIYAVMALAERHVNTEAENEERKRVLEELTYVLLNNKESVEVQFECVATFASVGDEVCDLVLSFLEGEDRLKLAEEIIRRFLSGSFVEPELSIPLLERCIFLLVARKNYSTHPSPSHFSLDDVSSSTPLSDTDMEIEMEMETEEEKEKEIQQLIHQSREALRNLVARVKANPVPRR